MSQYFSSSTSNKRSELSELAEDLNSQKLDAKKEALKKVIAHMTIGKDVSPLFQPVIKCLEVKDLEIIKLVYLYIINNSRSRPDDAIMVVEGFRRSATNKSSPLLRALAVRTMGCIRVKKINEYLIQPLKDLLSDDDPYVKKTAILCVPKVYEVSPEIIEQHGIVETLVRMLTKEGNSLVLANLLVVLNELSQMRGGKSLISLNYDLVQKLLLALNEGIEWGHIYILDNLVNYEPADAKEAESIIDRVIPRLSHINTAMVMSATKVIVKYMDYMTSQENIKALCKKISQPLITLLKQNPETVYVALRNLAFIVEKRPNILEKDVKVVFVDFNDPYYVKTEKLDMITRLCDIKNYEVVLAELSTYVNGVDPEFGRKALKAIGKICLKLDKAAERCVALLKTIITECSGAPHVLTESCNVLQIIFRKYPEKFQNDDSIRTLTDNIDSITEPEPRGALVWLIGEFAEKIYNSTKIITTLAEGFPEESPTAQLQILSAAVKNYLKKPDEAEDLIATILPLASDNNENPDVRDRGYIYWRLLSSDPEKTKKVVLGDRPIIQEETQTFDENLMSNLLVNIGNVSSVFHKTPDFLPSQVTEAAKRYVEEGEEEAGDEKVEKESKKEEKVEKTKESKKEEKQIELKEETKSDKKDKKIAPVAKPETKSAGSANLIDDFDLLGDPTPSTTTTTSTPQNNTTKAPESSGGFDLLDMDLLGGGSTSSTTTSSTNDKPSTNLLNFNLGGSSQPQGATPVPFDTVLNENAQGQNGRKGVKVEAAILRENNKPVLTLKVYNSTGGTLNDFLMQFKPNYFGLSLDQTPPTEVYNGASTTLKIGINANGPKDNNVPNPPLILTTGFKTNIDIFYFNVPCMFHTILGADGKLSSDDFKNTWKNIQESNEFQFDVLKVSDSAKNMEGIKAIANRNNIFFVTERQNDKNQQVAYFTAKSPDGTYFLAHIAAPSLKSSAGVTISCRSANKNLIPLFLQCSQFILTQS